MQTDANMIYYQHILVSKDLLAETPVAYYAEIRALWLLDTLQKHNIILSRIVVVINEPS